MDKNKNKILVISGLAALLLAISGITYAYFSSLTTNTNNTDFAANAEGGQAVFSALFNQNNISFNIGLVEMQQGDTNADEGKNTSVGLNVSLTSSNNNTTTTCEFDVVYTWAHQNNYATQASPSNYYYKKSSILTASDKEFTYQITGDRITRETQFPDAGAPKVVLMRESITSSNDTTATNKNYTIETKFYNIPNYDQSEQKGKIFAGTFSIENINCTYQSVYNTTDQKYLANYIGGHTSTFTGFQTTAKDGLKRFTGSSAATVKNYICLGDTSTSGTCNADNLYRIIGVVSGDTSGTHLQDGMIKVIKATPANNSTKYKWDGGTGKTTGFLIDTTYQKYNGTRPMSDIGTVDGYMPSWDESCLNKWDSARCAGSGTSAYSLNANTNSFLSGISFADKIAEVSWHCYQSKTTPTLNNELVKTNLCSNNQKIGLMYGSDYLYSYNNGTNTTSSKYKSWMTLGSDEWTMSSYGFNFHSARDYYWNAWFVNYSGNSDHEFFFSLSYGSLLSNVYRVRPVFYLKSTVEYDKGTGIDTDPIRIK